MRTTTGPWRALRPLSLLPLCCNLACGSDPAPAPMIGSTPIELVGRWASNFDESLEITAERWGSSTIVEHDAATRSAILQAPADDPWNPSKFSRVVWTAPDGDGFWSCTIDFGLATAGEARASTKQADASDPATGGCGSFAWTRWAPPFALRGHWRSDFGEFLKVTQIAWGASRIVRLDRDARRVILQSGADDEWTPSAFSRLTWLDAGSGAVHVCTESFGHPTLAALDADTTMADPSAPATGGCANFPWSRFAPSTEVGGHWFSNFGQHETVTSTAWGASRLAHHDDAANLAVLQSPPDDPFTPNQFSRVVWTEPSDEGFWYCTTDFGLATLELARSATTAADARDPGTTGCGGFPWTWLGRPLELTGRWRVDTATVPVASDTWGATRVVEFDNAANSAIVEDNGSYLRWRWTQPRMGASFWCAATGRVFPSADAARMAPDEADARDPASGGCYGAPWWTAERLW
jgi:hypothetical protein